MTMTDDSTTMTMTMAVKMMMILQKSFVILKGIKFTYVLKTN